MAHPAPEREEGKRHAQASDAGQPESRGTGPYEQTRTRAHRRHRCDLDAERQKRGVVDGEPAERTARIIVALYRGIFMMRTANPEVAGREFIEAVIAFVTRAQGIEV